VRIDRAKPSEEIRTPYLPDDLLPAEDLSGVGRQNPENVELLRGKTDRITPNRDLPTHNIYHEVGEHQLVLQSLGV
jgi:hypothetical protein